MSRTLRAGFRDPRKCAAQSALVSGTPENVPHTPRKLLRPPENVPHSPRWFPGPPKMRRTVRGRFCDPPKACRTLRGRFCDPTKTCRTRRGRFCDPPKTCRTRRAAFARSARAYFDGANCRNVVIAGLPKVALWLFRHRVE